MPLSDGHAQPDWIGGGSESRQMMQHAASTGEDIRQNGEKEAREPPRRLHHPNPGKCRDKCQ